MLKNDIITIVIISYKSKKNIFNLIKNIKNNYKIIVIENSNDYSIKEYLKIFSEKVDIFFTKNNGYGSSANFARKKITSEYFFLLNPDLIGVDDNMIESFLIHAKKLKDNFSCLGPRFKNITKKTFKQSNPLNNIGEVNAISGAAMFFNTSKFDLIGGFDENIFLYFEETDFCKRGKKISLKCYQINEIKITHNEGTSIEYSDDIEQKKIKNLCNWHFIWSKYYFYKKYYGSALSLFIFSPLFIRTIFKIVYSKILYNSENLEKYQIRLDGLLNSIRGKKSFKRLL